jgi:hypothetical protein
MSKALLVLANDSFRAKAIDWIRRARPNSRITFQSPRRTLPQNDRMWAMLTEVATQTKYHGIWLAPEDWKFLFLDSMNREMRIVPNLDGTGFVNLGRSTSDLGADEMSNLIEVIFAYGANHGVKFLEDRMAA